MGCHSVFVCSMVSNFINSKNRMKILRFLTMFGAASGLSDAFGAVFLSVAPGDPPMRVGHVHVYVGVTTHSQLWVVRVRVVEGGCLHHCMGRNGNLLVFSAPR